MVSLIEAVHKKYDEIEQTNIPGILISGSPGKSGGRLRLPRILVMDGLGIQTAGDHSSLKELTNDVSDLDLSNNSLESWDEIIKLLHCMNSLVSLNLGHNPLCRAPLLTYEAVGYTFSSLTTLVLNYTKVPWLHVQEIIKILPNLESLYFCLNDSSEILSPANDEDNSLQVKPVSVQNGKSSPTCSSLRNLYYNENGLKSWDHVCHLGRLFPQLTTLVLINNLLGDLSPEQVPELRDALPNLAYMNLSKNRISQWSSIDGLHELHELVDLRVFDLPVYQDWDEEQCRYHVISRLPDLKRLNGSEISGDERDRAERAFLRHFMDLSENEKCSRFSELESIHGKLDPLATVDLSPRDAVHILIRYEDKSMPYSLNLNQTVGQLKRTLCTLFEIERPSNIRMFYHDSVMKHASGPELLNYPLRCVHSYTPEEGDEIHLELKPGC